MLALAALQTEKGTHPDWASVKSTSLGGEHDPTLPPAATWPTVMCGSPASPRLPQCAGAVEGALDARTTACPSLRVPGGMGARPDLPRGEPRSHAVLLLQEVAQAVAGPSLG